MKNSILNGLITVIVLWGPSVALAEVNTTGTSRSTQQIKEARVEAREEIKDDVKDNIQRRTENRFEKMLDRYEATIDRLTTIVNRLNTRIEKIKANGGNTTEAEKLTASAKVHLEMATSALAILKTQAESQSTIENSSTNIKDLRNGIDTMKKSGKEIEKHLREAHKELQKTIGVLRGMSQLRPATSTSSITN